MENETYKKLSIECAVCKTKFEIWISTANFSPELEANIRDNFYRYCPVCKILEELKNKEK
jgi:hypothetical protein